MVFIAITWLSFYLRIMINKLIREISISIYKFTLLILLLATSIIGNAQKDSLFKSIPIESKTTLSIKAYLDIFYAYDFNNPTGNTRVPYMVNHNRHNEFNLNMGLLGVAVDNDRYHAILILQTGTYSNDNYVNEDPIMGLINEASAGFSLTRNKKLWLDAGILSSYIGYESLYQINALTLTRSLMVENVPYYLTGAQLTYTFNKKWKAMAMINNGWQRIKRVEGNSMMSYGTMLQFTPSDKVQLNWNTFIGTDDPDTTRRMRYFNEIFGIFSLNEKWELQGGFDYGIQQKSKGSSEHNPWFLASIITRYTFHKHWSASLRGEFVSDKYNVIISNPTPNEFVLWGISANLDYKPIKDVLARIEGRYWFSENQIFVKDDRFVTNDLFITLSLVILFGKDFNL